MFGTRICTHTPRCSALGASKVEEKWHIQIVTAGKVNAKCWTGRRLDSSPPKIFSITRHLALLTGDGRQGFETLVLVHTNHEFHKCTVVSDTFVKVKGRHMFVYVWKASLTMIKTEQSGRCRWYFVEGPNLFLLNLPLLEDELYIPHSLFYTPNQKEQVNSNVMKHCICSRGWNMPTEVPARIQHLWLGSPINNISVIFVKGIFQGSELILEVIHHLGYCKILWKHHTVL